MYIRPAWDVIKINVLRHMHWTYYFAKFNIETGERTVLLNTGKLFAKCFEDFSIILSNDLILAVAQPRISSEYFRYWSCMSVRRVHQLRCSISQCLSEYGTLYMLMISWTVRFFTLFMLFYFPYCMCLPYKLSPKSSILIC